MKKNKFADPLRPHSSLLLDGMNAPPRAMLYPVGFTEDGFKKPIIGIISMQSNITPCNMHTSVSLRKQTGTVQKSG